MDPRELLIFVSAAVALLVVPGPAVLYVVARGIDQGRSAALVSVLGIGTGAMVHVAAAAVGLSALLVSSATAFAAVKYLGAAYLIYLGIRTLLDHSEAIGPNRTAPRSMRKLFSEGVVVEGLNPKTALFFLAFLPQFVDPAAGNVLVQTLLLGALFVAIGICTDGCYALAAGGIRGLLGSRPAFTRAQRVVSGTIYLGLGAATAVGSPGRDR